MLPSGCKVFRPAYLKAAQELSKNEEQWEAYESTGHCVVLAGPGSGKTKVLTTKLARILHEDVEVPRGVACVTYSNECARELKRRLSRLGIKPDRRTFVGTVHSFCFQNVVVPFASLGGLKIANPIRVATASEQSTCFAAALGKAVSVNEKPAHWSLRCSTYRRRYLDRGHPTWRGGDEQAALVIEHYEQLLRSRGLIDFDDMMLLGLRLIEQHEWVRKVLQARFPVLVVDEYQDLGIPLHRLVLALCFPKSGPSTRLFAVGDPDQSIYGFTGAEPELLHNLSKRSDVESVTLRLNYRSRQYIISASEIALGEERGYRSVNSDVGTIDFYHCKDGLEHQARYITDNLIPEFLERGIARSLGEVAVLYRTKDEGDVIAKQVVAKSLDHVRIDGNAPYPKTPLTRWLEECAAWCAADDYHDAPSLREIIRECLGFNRMLRSNASRIEATHRLVASLWGNRDGSATLGTWIATLAEGFLRSHLSADPTMREELVALDKIIAATQPGKRLADWSVARFGGQGGSPDHLNLMTLHSAKGLEFDVVVLFGMDQGIIPSYREKSAESKLEPKRLFYVGITRARHEVHITYSGWRTTPWGARYNDGISEFVVDLANKLER
jgi:DNA helicase II / ATP-dependent DNA helicase PcrA